MKQIVCLSHTPWRARPNRTQQLLARLPDARVLFFEPPARRSAPRREGVRVRANIMVYTLPALFLGGLDQPLARRRNQTRVADYIQRAMDRHGFREPVLWCTTPEDAFLLDKLAYRCLVYDCQREWDGYPLEWESELALAADVIFAASQGLARRLSPCSDNIALLPNGANPAMFLRDDLSPPPSLARLRRPIFARVGDVKSDLDLSPLVLAAQREPKWTFLLIGRVSRSAGQALSPLPNVALAGAAPAVELPDYFSACQVFFDLLHGKRRGSDVVPSRIYEYFSTGKPVISMVDTEQPDPFPDVIYTAYDPAGFLRCCQAALEEDDPDVRRRRLAYARNASWSCRAREVDRILNLL